MGSFKSLDEAREFFEGDRFARTSGMEIDLLTDEECVCSVALTDQHRNAAGRVMGGVLFTLADFAFAVAANNRTRITVAQQADIHFLNNTRGSKLFARATCIKDGRNTCVYNIDITDDLGCEIAQFTGSGFKIPEDL